MPPIPSQSITRKRTVLKCAFCRIDKKKCEAILESERCERCTAKGFACSSFTVRPGGKPRRNFPPPAPPAVQANATGLVHDMQSQETVDSDALDSLTYVPAATSDMAAGGGYSSSNGVDSGYGSLNSSHSSQEVSYHAVERQEDAVVNSESPASPIPLVLSPQGTYSSWSARLQSARRERFLQENTIPTAADDSNSKDGPFQKLLRDKLELARTVRHQEPEKAEVYCRQIKHAALLLASHKYNVHIGETFTNAILLLIELLVADGRWEEVVEEYSSTGQFCVSNTHAPLSRVIPDDHFKSVKKAGDAVLGGKLMGFLETGLSLEEFISNSSCWWDPSSTSWRKGNDTALLGCIDRYTSHQLEASFGSLLIRAVELRRHDIVRSCLSILRPRVSRSLINRLIDRCLFDISAQQKTDSQAQSAKLGHRMENRLALFVRDILSDMIEEATSLEDIQNFLGRPNRVAMTETLHANQAALRGILETILEFERADVLEDLLKRDLGASIICCEMLESDWSSSLSGVYPRRRWIQYVIIGYVFLKHSLPNRELEVTSVFTRRRSTTILQLAVWTHRITIIQSLLEFRFVYSHSKSFGIHAKPPLDWHHHLLHLALLAKDVTVLKILLSYLKDIPVPMQPKEARLTSITIDSSSNSTPANEELAVSGEREQELLRLYPTLPSFTWSCVIGVCDINVDSIPHLDCEYRKVSLLYGAKTWPRGHGVYPLDIDEDDEDELLADNSTYSNDSRYPLPVDVMLGKGQVPPSAAQSAGSKQWNPLGKDQLSMDSISTEDFEYIYSAGLVSKSSTFSSSWT
ncbi:hypothetical protein BJ508DRAFT_313182 [Ascobolus immersus RN42]|uniref:Zn(2)-C6 fungal-type domain-containing protein n=1 Tax=Ascobolus immersus RN42 TaxID=1160509 RepID=A0A3N4HNM8_ASCIM|nr:hypothetical protein BJ508DRAFT_313182 [Ascobolus immersus RN42]